MGSHCCVAGLHAASKHGSAGASQVMGFELTHTRFWQKPTVEQLPATWQGSGGSPVVVDSGAVVAFPGSAVVMLPGSAVVILPGSAVVALPGSKVDAAVVPSSLVVDPCPPVVPSTKMMGVVG